MHARQLAQLSFVMLTAFVGLAVGFRSMGLTAAVVWSLLLGVSVAAVGVGRLRQTGSMLSAVNRGAQHGAMSATTFMVSAIFGAIGRLDGI